MSVKKESKKKLLAKLKKLKPNQAVYVMWADHYGELGWQAREYVMRKQNLMCHSIGFYIGHDEESIRLGATVDDGNGLYNNVQVRLLDTVYKINEIKY